MRSPRDSVRISTGKACIIGLLSFGAGIFVEPGAGGRGSKPEVMLSRSSCKATRKTSSGSVCMLNSDRKLVLWVDVPACETVRIEEDGRVLPATGKLAREGCRIEVIADSPQQTTGLSVSDASSGRPFWTLNLDRSRPELLGWTERIRQRADADLDSVGPEMQKRVSQGNNTEELMDFSLASGDSHQRQGLKDIALQEYQQAYEYAMRAEYFSVAADAALNEALILWQFGGKTQEALDLVQQAKTLLPAANARASLDLAKLEADLLLNQQRVTEALNLFRNIQADAERLDDREILWRTTHYIGQLLAELDRPDEVRPLLGKVPQLIAGANACTKAKVLADEGWTALAIATEATTPGTVLRAGPLRIEEVFLQALETHRRCIDSRKQANIYVGLAQTAFYELRLGDVQGWVAKARQEPGLGLFDGMDLLNTEARTVLKSGHADEAWKLFDSLETTSKKYPEEDRRGFECRAAIGMLESRHQDTQALAKVRSCIDSKTSGLSPAELRKLRTRATALGI